MTTKTEAEQKLEDREKELEKREAALKRREDALDAQEAEADEEPEDLTPYPTQAQNDAAKLGQREDAADGKAGYKTRDARAK